MCNKIYIWHQAILVLNLPVFGPYGEISTKQEPIGHVRYINIQARLRGLRVKIANF